MWGRYFVALDGEHLTKSSCNCISSAWKYHFLIWDLKQDYKLITEGLGLEITCKDGDELHGLGEAAWLIWCSKDYCNNRIVNRGVNLDITYIVCDERLGRRQTHLHVAENRAHTHLSHLIYLNSVLHFLGLVHTSIVRAFSFVYKPKILLISCHTSN
jgi:hypothetical protein